MISRLLEFVRLARKSGLRVSTAEVLDLVRAVEWVGLASPDALKAAMLATLCKRAVDEEAFDELFELFFFRRGEFLSSAEAAEAPLLEALRQQGLDEQQIEQLVAILADEASRMSPVGRASLGLRRTRLEALIRLAGLRVDFSRLRNPLQVGYFTQQLLEGVGFRAAQDEVRVLESRLAAKLGAERAREVVRQAEAGLERIRSQVRGYVSDEFERRNLQYLQQVRQQILAHKPFSTMSPVELARLRHEVTRLAKKLRQVASLRRRRQRRGRLDARRTLRRALGSGGVPFRLSYRQRRVEKPRLVVLCDISDSVRNVSRFMLQLAYTLQELFSQVRSFAFVSDLGECTELFRRHEIQQAVDLVYGGGVVNVYANSNFGRAFRLFVDKHLEVVTPRTTVIVIGDARNNYNPTEAGALADIKARAKRVLWLNPEPPLSWSFGDSVMREYEPYCDRVETVNDLAALERVVDSLIL